MYLSPLVPEVNSYLKKTLFFLLMLTGLPFIANANGFKFKIKNTAKTNVAVFYKINEKSGGFKLKALFNLKPGEMREKELTVKKDDTIAFYGQDAEDQTSVTLKRTFDMLNQSRTTVYYIPIISSPTES